MDDERKRYIQRNIRKFIEFGGKSYNQHPDKGIVNFKSISSFEGTSYYMDLENQQDSLQQILDPSKVPCLPEKEEEWARFSSLWKLLDILFRGSEQNEQEATYWIITPTAQVKNEQGKNKLPEKPRKVSYHLYDCLKQY